ncbi:MAG: CBS domain-containing protein [Planctomycetes bacterium]|nr:CBS domain-containing protein [Planctomycetota bacterium]
MQVSRFMTRHPVTVAPDASVEEAVRLMETHGYRHLPVQSDGTYVGVVSDRDLPLGTGGHALGSPGEGVCVRDVMSSPVVTVAGDERGPVAAARMVEQALGALPVLLDGHPAGIITETNLVAAFRDLCRDPAHADEVDADVEAVMRQPTVVLAPQQSLEEALALCTDWRLRHIPVMVEDDLVGMISDRDIRVGVGRARVASALAASRGEAAPAVPTVGEVMAREFNVVDPRDPVSHAVSLMLGSHVSALPVVVDDMLLGVLTRTDVLEHYAGVA